MLIAAAAWGFAFATKPAFAGAARAEAGLVLIPEREKVVLGRHDQVKLVLEVDDDLQLADDALPRLTASLGDISTRAKRLGLHRFEVVWQAPKGLSPAVAMVLARLEHDGGVLHAATRLILVGTADVEVKAPARSRVVLHIAGRRLGPRRPNADGVAKFRIQNVTPAVEHYEAEVINESNRIRIRRDIAKPAYAELLIGPLPKPKTHPASERLELAVVSADAAGNWRPAKEITCTVPGKRWLQRRNRGPLAIFGGTPAGNVRRRFSIRCRNRHGAKVRRGIVLAPAGIASLALIAPASHRAGDPSPEVTVVARDARDRPTSWDASAMITLQGEPEGLSIQYRFDDLAEAGTTTAKLPIPNAFAPAERLRVTVLQPPLSAEAVITLKAAEPHRIEVSNVGPLPADGKTSVELLTTVRDVYGNPSSVALTSRSELGSTTVKAGAVTYLPPRLFREATDTLTFHAGGVTETLQVKLVPTWWLDLRLAAGAMVNQRSVWVPLVALGAGVSKGHVGAAIVLAAGRGGDRRRRGDVVTKKTFWIGTGSARACWRRRWAQWGVRLGAGAGGYLVRSESKASRAGTTLQPTRTETGLAPYTTLFVVGERLIDGIPFDLELVGGHAFASAGLPATTTLAVRAGATWELSL